MATQKKQPAPEQPGYVKTHDVAALLDLSDRRVQQLTSEGILKRYRLPAGERYNLPESVRAYVRYIREANAKKEQRIGPAEKAKAEAEADLKETQARMAQIRLRDAEAKYHEAAAAHNDGMTRRASHFPAGAYCRTPNRRHLLPPPISRFCLSRFWCSVARSRPGGAAPGPRSTGSSEIILRHAGPRDPPAG